MTNVTLNRPVVAAAQSVRNGEAVRLRVEPDGIAPDFIEMTRDEAKELAEQLLKASGVKFTLKI